MSTTIYLRGERWCLEALQEYLNTCGVHSVIGNVHNVMYVDIPSISKEEALKVLGTAVVDEG